MSDAMDTITAELAAESAASLGRAGRALEGALGALAAHAVGDRRPRAELVDVAAYYAWSYVVLRGALGFGDDDDALRAYRVPAEVRARIGAVRSPPGEGIE
ncbi:MAG: hypothetical protein IPL61_21925 [Myxococcales bacterium]|nr:hypothetical protein [Myxococcales bacterium]